MQLHILLLLIHYGQSANGDVFNVDPQECSADYDYGFVIDGGSTGTRIYAFQWAQRIISSTPHSHPDTNPRMVGDALKVGPLSSIQSQQDAYDLLTPLIDHAKNITENVSCLWDTFPIYLKATAGIRMLSSYNRIHIFNWTRTVFQNKDKNPFLYDDSFIVIASGSEEALFDWLSVNYLMNTLTNESESLTYGALDLGGASTQIAFTPVKTFGILGDLMLAGPFDYPWRVYAKSYLGYGKNEMERQIAAKVYMANTDRNPCLLSGTNKTYDFIRVNYTKIYNVTQIGVADSNIELCERYLHEILYLHEHECLFDQGKECSINGQYLPNLPSDMSWIAFDNFAEKIKDTPGLHERSTIAEIYNITVNTLCKMRLDELIVAAPGIDEPEKLCIMDLYIVVLLRDGYGFDVNKRNIHWTNIINGEPAGWQWGSILYDAKLLPYEMDCETSEPNGEQTDPTWMIIAIVFIMLFGVALIILVGNITQWFGVKLSPKQTKRKDGAKYIKTIYEEEDGMIQMTQ